MDVALSPTSTKMISSYLNPIPTLPKPLGPHKVGTTEWEIPSSEIPSSAPVPDSKISTIKFRIYYPTTDDASSKVSVPWLPQPQGTWQKAYAAFLGFKPRVQSILSALPFTLNYTNIPAVADAPLLPREKSSTYPVAIFSHGLGGNYNTYSSVCTSLASFGIVCVAPEHRDGSAPVSLIRSSDGSIVETIPYQKHAHTPTTEVLNSRNAQLRIRLWELDQLFSVLSSLNEGKNFSNYAYPENKAPENPSFKGTLDFQPGHVTWVGHSFGAATIAQFVKSVYYHESMPSLKGTPYENDLDWRPIYKASSNSELVKQITPESPIGFLDLWTMPLRSDLTKWLWERPLPCYDRKVAPESDHATPNVVAVVTAEFYKYTELLNRMKAALSAKPAEIAVLLDRRNPPKEPKFDAATILTPPNKAAALEPELDDELDLTANEDVGDNATSSTSTSSVQSRASSPSPSETSSVSSAASSNQMESSASLSTTSFAPAIESTLQSPTEPKLFLIPESAHLSQSDFGVLFPRLTRYLMNAQEPIETIHLNVRAILAAMRGMGLVIEAYTKGEDSEAEIDEILTDRCPEKRFVPQSLVE
ncbi:1-alkyl-2-acetylglycerophosphocholine esterase [Exophiala viscosa]|uniref:Putative phospholipase n=1 Tax=Exophiala viscosa TaxID=2486360 RepID=A0AAN6DN85_9EURO|nr:1-alkyl-2-acetylglycerophosphocholine esterase [Exophiala viscosa]